MRKPRLLDLFCCQGCASVGYRRAGWAVYGVDLDHRHQRWYPFAFHHGNALTVLALLIAGHSVAFTHPDGTVERLLLSHFDAIHASPPCQKMTRGNAGRETKHLNLIPDTRALLEETGLPWVIENVEDAGRYMRLPVLLCGSMFGLATEDEDGFPLRLERHRLFETNWPLLAPTGHYHDPDVWAAGVYNGGRQSIALDVWDDDDTGQMVRVRAETPAEKAPRDRYAARYLRHGGYVPRSENVRRRLMGVDWPTTRKALTEGIPPAYAEHVGRQLLEQVAA